MFGNILGLSLGQVEGSYDYKTIMTELHRGKQTRIHGFILPAQMRYWPLLNIFSYLIFSFLILICVRSQVAWAWTRRKIMHLMPDWVRQFPSNFELLHLAYEALLSTEILWIISTYCSYVSNEKMGTITLFVLIS